MAANLFAIQSSDYCFVMLRRSALILLVGPAAVAAIASRTDRSLTPEAPAERIWIAGRYDGDRVVIYFATAHFHDTVPASAAKIAEPKADAFFDPDSLSRADVARFRDAGTEQFAAGDRYDLILDSGHVATITLTSLVGFMNDEQVGNDSYVGALGRVSPRDMRFFTKDYYVVRPHDAAAKQRFVRGGLMPFPASSAVQSAVAQLLRTRLGSDTGAAWTAARRLPFTFTDVTPFRLPDGSPRYYARAFFGAKDGGPCTNVEAWLTVEPGRPGLRVLATAPHECAYDWPKELPELMNAIDLGDGRIASIMNVSGTDGRSLVLYEYRDGATLADMRILQRFGASE
jgi:hypothetical protein